jgi:hypothetical protein
MQSVISYRKTIIQYIIDGISDYPLLVPLLDAGYQLTPFTEEEEKLLTSRSNTSLEFLAKHKLLTLRLFCKYNISDGIISVNEGYLYLQSILSHDFEISDIKRIGSKWKPTHSVFHFGFRSKNSIVHTVMREVLVEYLIMVKYVWEINVSEHYLRDDNVFEKIIMGYIIDERD